MGKTKLLEKTLIIICLTLIGMILLMYATAEIMLMDTYASMENADVKDSVCKALSTLNYDLSTLDMVTVDYASWDDTCQFVSESQVDDTTPYVLSNLIDTTFRTQRLNAIIYLDSNDSLVFDRYYDLVNRSYIARPAGFPGLVKPGSPLPRSGSNESTHGLIMLDGKPMLVSAYPIKDSEGTSPTMGTLIMGRYLDAGEIGLLGNVSGLSIGVEPYAGDSLPDDYKHARLLLGKDEPIVARPITASSIGGYTVLDDVFGKPAVLVRVDEKRSIFMQGRNSMLYIIVSMLLTGLVFGIVAVFLFEKAVISRISQLGETVHSIGKRADRSARVEVKGNDEVAALARTINITLDSLQSSRQELAASEAHLKKMTEELQLSNDELDIRVQQRTAELANVVQALQVEVGERRRAEEQISASLKEKELLLKEIHHRVKNNLQVISSLLSLQSDYIEDEYTLSIFRESQDRVKSMALIHERLYQSKDFTGINFGDYIRKLIDSLSHSYGNEHRNIRMTVTSGDISLGIDTAIPCGLIINELLTNSFKYAFPDGRSGEIQIEFCCEDPEKGKYRLIVQDNGVGMHPDIDIENTKTLGLQLVVTLAEQLNGKIVVMRHNGTKFIIVFYDAAVRGMPG